MNITSQGIHFKSSQFKIIEGEDDQTNPCRYGVELAAWLQRKLIEIGYKETHISEDDWGRCVTVENKKYFLFVGCSSVCDYQNNFEEFKKEQVLKSQNNIPLEWYVFISLQYPSFSIMFLSKEVKEQHKIKYKKLESDIINIINSEPEFEKV